MLALWSLGPGELVGILIIAVLVFGRRLPDVARAVGKGIGEFRSAIDWQSHLDDDEYHRPGDP